MTTWYRYKERKPTESKSYICCCLLSDFSGGDYSLDQIILKYDADAKSFDIGNGISVLYWTECLEWPVVLRLEPDEDNED